MSWFDRIIIGLIGGAVAFVLWLMQRRISRAAENEAIDRLPKKLDVLEKLEKHGLPNASIASSVAHDMRTISAATEKNLSSPQEISRIVESIKVAAGSERTKIVTDAELDSLQEERADTYEELISLLLSSANTYEGMAHINEYDAFFDLLACYHRAKAMRITALIEASGVQLGSGGITAGVLSIDELEQKVRTIPPEQGEDEASAKEVEDFRAFTLRGIDACKSAREKLDSVDGGSEPQPAK